MRPVRRPDTSWSYRLTRRIGSSAGSLWRSIVRQEVERKRKRETTQAKLIEIPIVLNIHLVLKQKNNRWETKRKRSSKTTNTYKDLVSIQLVYVTFGMYRVRRIGRQGISRQRKAILCAIIRMYLWVLKVDQQPWRHRGMAREPPGSRKSQIY